MRITVRTARRGVLAWYAAAAGFLALSVETRVVGACTSTATSTGTFRAH